MRSYVESAYVILFSVILSIGFSPPVSAQSPVEVAKLLPSDGEAIDQFGFAVDFDGSTVIVGSIFDDDAGDRSGSAYVFQRVLGNWAEIAKLTAGDAEAFDEFGWSVAVDERTIAVGSYREDGGVSGLPNSGSVYLFELLDGIPRQIAKLRAEDAAFQDRFGYSLAVDVFIDGGTLVVGADGDDDAGSNSGAAYVFELIDGIWVQVAKLTASDGAEFDFFGSSVAVFDDEIIVGARGAASLGTNFNGSAYVYRKIDGVWTEISKLTASDGSFGDEFGYAVSIEGATALVGAHGSGAGAAYIFDGTTVDPGDPWIEEVKLQPLIVQETQFGWSVDLDGSTALIGAFRGGLTGPGAAFIFEEQSGGWTELARISPAEGDVGDNFGSAVAMRGNIALVGARGDDDAAANAGAAYLFDISGGGGGPSDQDNDDVSDELDNCPVDPNPLQGDIDLDGAGDICDPCPSDAEDLCDPDGTGAREVASDEGGIVVTTDELARVEIDPGDLKQDETISITRPYIENPYVDVILGSEPGLGRALAIYKLEPSGIQFDAPVSASIQVDVSPFNEFQRREIDLYRLDELSDIYVALEANCQVDENPLGVLRASCAAQLEGFSTYAAVVPRDTDNDGVPDSFSGQFDACPTENATGLDVDGDGCIDSIGALAELVAGLIEESVIDDVMGNSIISKIANAEASTTRSNICTAVSQLEALIAQVSAQTGKKISIEAAESVTAYAESVQRILVNDLPDGETCR